MSIMKECEICGEAYEANRSSQKYCKECGKRPETARKRYVIAVAVNKRHAGESYRVYDLNCCQCGKSFKSSYISRKFCSDTCERQHNIENAKCSNCGKRLLDFGIKIETQGGWHYCSDKCREEYLWERARKSGHIYTCKYCGVQFIRKQGGSFCSKDCYKKAIASGWNSRQPKPPKSAPTRESARCKECGKPFMRIVGATYHEYCSPKCRAVFFKKFKEDKATADKKRKEAEKIQKMGLCWCCKTPYPDCERMSSGFQYSPEGTVFQNGKVMQCPKFTQ